MEGIWGVVLIAGPLLLMAVLLWAKMRNRTTTKQWDRGERATKRMYEEEGRQAGKAD